MAATGLEFDQGTVDTFLYRTTLPCPFGFPQARPGLVLPQLRLHPVEVGDLAQEPSGAARGLLKGFMELAPCVCPARGQRDRFPATLCE
jgi:hypothetical protein